MQETDNSSKVYEGTTEVKADEKKPERQRFGNRKQHRAQMAINRRRKRRPAGAETSKRATDGKHFRFLDTNAFESVLKSMTGCPRVMRKFKSGALTPLLNKKDEHGKRI